MNKVILHTEASLGFGGQEIRILKESIGMRKLGYKIVVAAPKGAKILEAMKKEGFSVYEVPFEKKYLLSTLYKLRNIIKNESISLINTHSSLDSWLGGIAGRLFGVPIIRTRHLSSPIRKGLNSYLLYNLLADYVVTTCEEVVAMICTQAKIDVNRCSCIATGTDPSEIKVSKEDTEKFRESWGIKNEDLVVGTLCVVRSWKGISDFLKAAAILKAEPRLKWLIVGSGPSSDRFKNEAAMLGVDNLVIFTGHIMPPYTAISAIDIFMLLSTANEGISQATLQAAYLKKPLITTPTGGLKEVCIPGQTGFIVPKNSPEEVAKAIISLMSEEKRKEYGENAKELVLEKFTLENTLSGMMKIYNKLLGA